MTFTPKVLSHFSMKQRTKLLSSLTVNIEGSLQELGVSLASQKASFPDVMAENFKCAVFVITFFCKLMLVCVGNLQKLQFSFWQRFSDWRKSFFSR